MEIDAPGQEVSTDSDSDSGSISSDYDFNSDSDSETLDVTGNAANNLDFTVPDVKANPPDWTQDLEPVDVPEFQKNGGPRLPDNFGDMSNPMAYFKLFFTDKLIRDIVKNTNQYAHIEINKKRRTKPAYVDKEWSLDGSNNITERELWAYIGVCIILSVNPSRQLRHIFSADPFLHNAGIRNVFTLKRFMKISHYFCVSDKANEPPRDSENYDKLYKIRPVVELLNKLFPRYYQHGKRQTIDESSIKMKSKDAVRIFSPMKPAKFSWKVWSRCDSESPSKPYLLQFIPYLGKKHTKVSKYGLFFDVVNELTKQLRGSNARVYTDSAYGNVKTALFLMKHSIYMTSTVRSNSIGLPPSVKAPPKKLPRGSYKIFQDKNNRNLTSCYWMDTKAVKLLSCECNPMSITFALRRVQARYERIHQPLMAFTYSSYYKSVDFFDYWSTKYSIARRSYRPWKYMWHFCLQASIVNAYILFIETNKQPRNRSYCQSDFRLSLGKLLIGGFSVRKLEPRVEPFFVGPESPPEQFVNHQNCRMPKSRGCLCKIHTKYFQSKQRTVYGCRACNVYLCKFCHPKWHQ